MPSNEEQRLSFYRCQPFGPTKKRPGFGLNSKTPQMEFSVVFPSQRTWPKASDARLTKSEVRERRLLRDGTEGEENAADGVFGRVYRL